METIGFGRFHIALFLIMGSTGVSAPWRLFESQKVIHHETCRTFHGLPALACPFREGCEREQEPCEVDNLLLAPRPHLGQCPRCGVRRGEAQAAESLAVLPGSQGRAV